MLKAGALSLVLLAACGVGDDGGGGGGSNTTTPGLKCVETYTTHGSVMNVPAIPDNDGDGQPDIQGCWPAGLWSFTATAAGADGVDPECSPAPSIEPKYEVQIDYGCYPAGKSCAPDATPDMAGEYGFDVQLKTGPTLRNHLKYSSGGGGLCEGIFEFFSDDGKQVWGFHPTLQADSSLDGHGEFGQYDHDQWSP